MYLILNYVLSDEITSDDVRSLWLVLIKQQPTTFQLMSLPDDVYQAADDVINGDKVNIQFFYKNIYYPMTITYQHLKKMGYLLSFTFTDANQIDILLNQPLNAIFFNWVLRTLEIGGNMLYPEIGFLSFESSPNAYVNISLDEKAFSISQYPLLFWFAHIQVPPQFLQESDFVRHNSKGGSYFLLPQGFLETIQTNPQK